MPYYMAALAVDEAAVDGLAEPTGSGVTGIDVVGGSGVIAGGGLTGTP
ncbi:MAG TPA: hypothetical protein VME66_09940 [Candidatus Acidoferrales bacterium]|nr:hypothetical protein [Candidatus Acidoferrales bacterium]